ncbi:MAG: hypothetical protein FWH02_05570, partial [Oscillospiraceae bacterium]|nr:hypothetical protein [Oscillospiraceae bacterium]
MNTFFGRHLEFRVRLFNLLAWSGLTLCVTSSINGFFINAGIYNLMASITVAGLTVLLLWYSLKSGNYQRCYTLTVIGIFLGLYPFYFFNSGGYYGGMPLHFIFALLFTVTMMTGKKMIAFIIVEMLFYTALYMYAYFYPENIRYFDTEANMLSDMVFSFLLCGLVLSVTFALNFRLYEQTLREL